MKIQINYGVRTKLSEEEIHQIIELSQKYGDVRTEKMESRSGPVDLVTFLKLFFLSFFAKPILDGFFKGLFGEDYFKKLGTSARESVAQEVQDFKSYLTNLFQVFVSKKA
jgi:hypothetical protein